MIPKIIYFCNKTITQNEIQSSNEWKVLNPEYEIILYDDEKIKQFLLEEYGKIHLDIFNYLKDGPIKADFWRLCILYKNGGIYSDIDNVPLLKISDFLEKDVDFVTCSSYIHYNFNPNFIMSNKNNVILQKCIDLYVKKYNRKDKYDYWKWSVMRIFHDTLRIKNYNKKYGVYSLNDMKIQIIQECAGENHYDAHNIYNNIRIFNNRTSLWDCDTHSFR